MTTIKQKEIGIIEVEGDVKIDLFGEPKETIGSLLKKRGININPNLFEPVTNLALSDDDRIKIYLQINDL